MGRRLIIALGLITILSGRPVPAQSSGGDAQGKPPAAQAKGDLAPPPDGPSLPGAIEAPLEDPEPASKSKQGGKLVLAPRRDDELLPAQAQAADPNAPVAAAQTPPAALAADAPAAAPGGDAGTEARGGILSAEQIPLGKQEVVLSIDVQSPANMNFEMPATVKIIVRNGGSSDAQGVVVRDELPPGLTFLSSQPEAQPIGSLLTWKISTLPANSDRVILLRVKPTKPGAFDHAATVSFQAASKASCRVLRPRLKVEVVQNPSDGKVLKGKTADFRIAVTNIGDGTARNVIVQAKLSPGLRHDTGEHNEDNSFELPIPEIRPGQREELDPLTVDATTGGSQSCKVSARSADVVFDKEEAEVTRTIDVVEPKLKLTFVGPDKRFTDTVAPYGITLENLGDAPARNVRVLVTLGVSGRLVAVPPGAKYDSASRRLQWTVLQIDPKEKPRTLPFEVRMGGISAYEVGVEARADNGIYLKDRKITDVQGMPDVDLVVRERRRVVDVDGSTTFQIRLRNYGTKEATKLIVSAKLSENLIVDQTAGGPEEAAYFNPETKEVKWPVIDKLGPGKEMILAIKVKVTKSQPRLGTCRVTIQHDELTEPLEDMAGVKVTESRRAAVTQ